MRFESETELKNLDVDPSTEAWKKLFIPEPETGATDPFENAVDGILSELRDIMLRKHHDYGPLNIALAPGGAVNGLRVRMHDKLARINNLTDRSAQPENESLQDSFLDLSNYGIIGLMVLRGLWPGCEEGK